MCFCVMRGFSVPDGYDGCVHFPYKPYVEKRLRAQVLARVAETYLRPNLWRTSSQQADNWVQAALTSARSLSLEVSLRASWSSRRCMRGLSGLVTVSGISENRRVSQTEE